MTTMATGCACASYKHLELLRDDVTTRIRETNKLRENLRHIEGAGRQGDALYQCVSCGQLWQESLAWGWDTEDDTRYLFQVPTIPVHEWRQSPFVRPHELLGFAAAIDRVTKGLSEKDEPCRTNGCIRKAVTHSVFCLRHHIESLQKIRSVPSWPLGRWFPPYDERGFAPP